MQIFINGRFLTQQMAGVQRYAFELASRLVKKNDEIKILVPEYFDTNGTGINEKHFVKTGRQKNLIMWEQIHLPFYLLRHKGLLINFCNTAPLFVTNQLVCLHDLAFFKNPAWFSKAFYLYYKFIIPKLVNKVRQIVTVSEFSRQEIVQRFKLDGNRIAVIPNAPSAKFICPSAEALEYEKEDFFLFVGSLDPRKNLNTLLRAFASPDLRHEKLIVVGKKWSSFNYESAEIPSNVTMFDNCGDEILAYLYKKAKGLINCSLYEGFGLPIVEAMASGCPLILSDIPVFHEVAGRHATYFQPLSAESIVEAVMLTKSKDKETLDYSIKYNYRLSFGFSWQKSAGQLQHVIDAMTPHAVKQFKLSSTYPPQTT